MFVFSEDVGSGIPLFLPKGEILRHTMETYVRDLQTKYGYQHVWTGHIAKEDLYRKSGHLDNYGDKVAGGMFPPMIDAEWRTHPAQADELPVAHDAVQCPACILIATCPCAMRSSPLSTDTKRVGN